MQRLLPSRWFNPSYPRSTSTGTPVAQPDLAWVVILVVVLLTATILAVKAGGLLRYGFPALTTLAGIVLFQRFPHAYVGYTWWVWFLTAFVRRLADLQAGYQEPSPILLAPFLVTLVSGLTVAKKLPSIHRDGGLPLLMAIAGIVYALLIGIINQSARAVVVPLLGWISPIVFSFHLFCQWREYPAYSQLIRRTFLWMALIVGAYGVYQYVVAPEWDTSWLINTGLTSSGGKPAAYGMRIFSTIHSAAPFAVIMMAGLLLLFSTESPLQFPATAVGYLSFLLSLVRAAWLGWGVGFLVLLTSLKPKLQMRLFVTCIVMVFCIAPLLLIEPFGEVIRSRFESLGNLEADDSYQGRSGIYEGGLANALLSGTGLGLGGSWRHVDSGVIDTLIQLGWIGTLLYIGGMILLMLRLFQSESARFDPFVSASRGICLGIFVMQLFGSYAQGVTGVVFWAFLVMGLAGQKYYSSKEP